MKKTWNEPKLVKLEVSKTYGTKGGSNEYTHGCGTSHAADSRCS